MVYFQEGCARCTAQLAHLLFRALDCTYLLSLGARKRIQETTRTGEIRRQAGCPRFVVGTWPGGWPPLNSEKRLWVAHPCGFVSRKGGVFLLFLFPISSF